jgi:hypothetical protein
MTVLGVSSAAALFGASPVAQVIGTESITVAGIAAPARNFVPLAPGDDVATQSGTAVVQFRDGSNITLQSNSILRVEGQAGSPVVRVVQGSASYDLAPSSRLRVLNSRGETINRVLDSALPAPAQLGSGSPLTDPLAALAMARSASRQPGVVLPTTNVMTGSFVSGGNPGAGSVNPVAVPNSAVIILPSGVQINLSFNTATGAYTVASIQEVINGVTITSSSGGLVGATVSGLTGITATNTQVSIGFTPSGSSTPLTPAQIASTIQTSMNTAVQAAVAGGSLPAGTVAPTPSPVITGSFSASGA